MFSALCLVLMTRILISKGKCLSSNSLEHRTAETATSRKNEQSYRVNLSYIDLYFYDAICFYELSSLNRLSSFPVNVNFTSCVRVARRNSEVL